MLGKMWPLFNSSDQMVLSPPRCVAARSQEERHGKKDLSLVGGQSWSAQDPGRIKMHRPFRSGERSCERTAEAGASASIADDGRWLGHRA